MVGVKVVWRQSGRSLRAREQGATHLNCTPGRFFGPGAAADGVTHRGAPCPFQSAFSMSVCRPAAVGPPNEGEVAKRNDTS